ncbi:hypothetical protein [Flavisolibacter tropicus]|uniref:hypothetical protein n=1 Tax=Flavisolibacter tropicus TaxID=1492898 RepID=UPI001D04FE15|nr:hypothetical protein [Flavisolibacter tropicus]
MRINTKLVMTASAIILAAIGLTLTFFPAEIAGYIESSVSKTNQLTFQVLGALYFAFATLNWMAKDSVIGGIYNRPISIANLTHFLVGGLALIKLVFNNTSLPITIQLLTGVYTLFAILFGYIFYNNPVPAKKA